MKKNKQPSPEDAARCLHIRKEGKSGHYTSPEDNRFCEKMFNDYPEWYAEKDEEVFNDTVPFGSDVRYRK